MKLIFENWRKYLTEQTSLFGYDIKPDEKVFVSKNPFSSLKNVTQLPPQPVPGKPKGLWYSCGDEWIEWLEYNMPEWLDAAKYLYRIKLGSGIYHISNEREFEAFEEKYVRLPEAMAAALAGMPDEILNNMKTPDFAALQADGYTGIEACPYLHSKRDLSMWYYSWDVASGCIWDSRGIDSVELVAERA